MKKILFTIMFILTTTSYAHQVESIRDIPWSYTGIAGNLFQEYKVELKISELLSTTTEESSFGPVIKNTVKGQLKIGTHQIINITDFDLHFSNEKKVITIYITCDNKFEKTLVMSLRYDLINNNFVLKELPFLVQKSRFELKGPLK